MFTDSSTNESPYSVQFNSDPRARHSTGTHHQRRSLRFMSNPSNEPFHPYIAAQQKSKCKISNIPNQSNESNPIPHSSPPRPLRVNQAIPSTNSPVHSFKGRRCLKRKYMETFDESEEGQIQYQRAINGQPKMKQHVTEQMMMRSMRECNVNDEKEDILKVTVCEPSRSRKRRFEAISSESVAECKDDGDRLSDLEPLIKRIKLSECSENDDCRAIETTAFTLNDDVESELIPKRIEFAEYRDDTVLAALCRNDSVLQRMSLNGRNGALVKYESPSKSWRDLVQRYFVNGKRCDVREFTEMDGTGKVVNNEHEGDSEMIMKDQKKRKRKSVRLHTSYAGFTGDGLVGKDELKKIANQCYAASVIRKERTSLEKESNDHNVKEEMDCD